MTMSKAEELYAKFALLRDYQFKLNCMFDRDAYSVRLVSVGDDTVLGRLLPSSSISWECDMPDVARIAKDAIIEFVYRRISEIAREISEI